MVARYQDPAEGEQCLTIDPERGFLCTRERGHGPEDPLHVAHEHGTLRVVREWETAPGETEEHPPEE